MANAGDSQVPLKRRHVQHVDTAITEERNPRNSMILKVIFVVACIEGSQASGITTPSLKQPGSQKQRPKSYN